MHFRELVFPNVLTWVAALLLAQPVGFAADKDLQELQRQLALMGDQVKNLQSTVDGLQNTVSEKLGAMGALVQQTLDRANQIHTDNAVLANHLGDQLAQQQQKIAEPVASLNAKLDQVSSEVSAAQDSLADLTTRLGRLEQRMVDLENALKAIQTQPAPPPSSGQVPHGPSGAMGIHGTFAAQPAPPAGGSQVQAGPPAGITAEGLFQNAMRDQLSGKTDLALQEYRDYIRYFGDTESAVTAEFHIGEILLNQGNVDQAIQAFDIVAGEHPKSPSAPDALYLKAEALKKQGDQALANHVLSQLIRQYPDSAAAGTAKTELAQ